MTELIIHFWQKLSRLVRELAIWPASLMALWHRLSGRQQTSLSLLLLILGSSAYYLSYYRFAPIFSDEGWTMETVQRVMDGQIIHRDFSCIYPFGRFYLFARLFETFGTSLLVLRLFFLIIRVVIVGLTFTIAGRFMPLPHSLMPSFIILLVPGPWYASFNQLIILVGIGINLAVIIPDDRPKSLIIAGIACGLSAMLRQDLGIFFFIATVLTLIGKYLGRYRHLRRVDQIRQISRAILILSATVILVWLPALIYFGYHGALANMFADLFQLPQRHHSPAWQVIINICHLKTRGWNVPGESGTALVVLFISAIYLFFSARTGWRFLRQRAKTSDLELASLLCFAWLSFNQCFRYETLYYLLQYGLPAYILVYHLLFSIGQRLGERQRSGSALLLGVLLGLNLIPAFEWFRHIATSHEIGENWADAYYGTILARFGPQYPLQIRGDHFFVDASTWTRIQKIERFKRREKDFHDLPVLLDAEFSLLYFIWDIKNPCHIIQFERNNWSLQTAPRREECLQRLDSGGYLILSQWWLAKDKKGLHRDLLRHRPARWAKFIRRIYPFHIFYHAPAGQRGRAAGRPIKILATESGL
jgi:hypothetical protein